MVEQTSANVFSEDRYAGFWIRFGATLLDLLIIGILIFLVDLIISLIVGYRVGFLTDLESE